MIDAAAKVNGRTLNAEINARLQWTFDAGYDAQAETEAVQRTALSTIQASPLIRMEKRLLAVEARLENEIDELKAEVSALKSMVGKTAP